MAASRQDRSVAGLLRQGLRLPHLRLLVAVEDHGQISGAAAQIGLTQPAASRLLSELERTAGTRLYDRHARGVALTEPGLLLARHARATLQDLAVAFEEVDRLTQGVSGLVRVGTVTGPGLELVLPMIRDMRITHPEIEFDVLVDTSDRLAASLIAHRIDFYIGRVLGDVNPGDLTFDRIGPEPLAMVVRKDHPLASRRGLTLSDTLEYDWVMQPPGGLMRQAIADHLTRHGLPPPSRIVSTASLLLTLGIIVETNVVAPLAQSVADILVARDRVNADVRILDIASGMAVAPYGLIRRSNSAPAPVVGRVLSYLEGRVRARSLSGGPGDVNT